MPSGAKRRTGDAAALRAIDELLQGGGLQHGTRRIRAGSPAARRQKPNELQETPPTELIGRQAGELQLLLSPRWDQAGVPHGFSTRPGGVSRAYCDDAAPLGDLNLGFTASDERENVEENRRRLLAAVGAQDRTLVGLRQIHSGLTYRVDARDSESLRKGDGIMTDDPRVLLSIQTADCVPVLVRDARTNAVAAFHAGWRGTLKRIVEGGIGKMGMEFGSRPEDLEAAIGPAVGACCYAVGEEVRVEFSSQFSYAPELFCEVYDSDPIREKYPLLFLTQRAPGHSNLGPNLHLNLVEANRRQLVDAGLRPEAIATAWRCTSCERNTFFSYRAEHGFCGRMMTVIGPRA